MKLQQAREAQLEYIRRVAGTTTAYLDPEKAGTFHDNVLTYSKRNKNTKSNSKTSKTKIITACHVLDCGGAGSHACKTNECLQQARTFCDFHYKGGGHKKHLDKGFKPSVRQVSLSHKLFNY